MFTIEQIKAAHSKVKSGSDYPHYVQDLIKLGVTGYETYVADGNTFYEGTNGYKITSGTKYGTLKISDESNKDQLIVYLKTHQQGKSDYHTFCIQCAESGIEKWVVDFLKMTCSYCDRTGAEILVEKIPGF